MKEKEEKPGFFKLLILAGFIFLANAGFFTYKYRGNFSGYAISDGIVKTYTGISPLSKIIFAVQWVVILLALTFMLFRDRRLKSRTSDINAIHSKKLSGKSATDLDTLYSILQEKKKLKISTISKAFKINKDTAFEWCKILESGNLAVIDYPGIGEPVVKIT
ncbi:MAG: hypothetical protein ABH840_04755 [Nanoarchaeota archaeon]